MVQTAQFGQPNASSSEHLLFQCVRFHRALTQYPCKSRSAESEQQLLLLQHLTRIEVVPQTLSFEGANINPEVICYGKLKD